MKKILTMGLMCAATLAFTNCDKQDVEPQVPAEKTPFTIIASAVDTKTTNDGLKTVWAENDALNVFHAVAGTTDYGTNDKFTFTGADNKFTGNLATPLETGKSYDWYALYPYSNFIKNPTNSDKAGYTYIGERSDQTQIQTGNDSKSHLIYDETKNASLRNCPLYAVAKNVAASSTPTFTMKHLASVVAVNVTNTNDAPLTVSSVSFTAPTGTSIVGTYYINFTDNGDALYVDGQYPGNVANLTVKNGTAIAKNGSAKFYLAIKPFAATSGQKLSISVNGYSKEVTLDKNIEFQAGHIVPVNFKYNKPATSETTITKTIGDLPNLPDNGLKMESVKLDEVITVTADGTGNNGKYYESGKNWRFYQSGSGGFTIKAANGYTLKNATITFTTEKSGVLKYSEATVTSKKALALSGSSASFNVGSSKGTSGQVRVSAISVTYE